jgi:hypothetical protein
LLSLTNVILGCVAAVLGLGVAVLLGVFWTSGDHWPFAVPTTTSTSSVTIYPVDVASRAVAASCGAVGRLTSDFMHDKSRGSPVPSSASGAQQDAEIRSVEMVEEASAVLPQYSSIVSATRGLSATLQQNVGSQRWQPVTTALSALAAQCQLLGIPTGASGSSNP